MRSRAASAGSVTKLHTSKEDLLGGARRTSTSPGDSVLITDDAAAVVVDGWVFAQGRVQGTWNKWEEEGPTGSGRERAGQTSFRERTITAACCWCCRRIFVQGGVEGNRKWEEEWSIKSGGGRGGAG